MIRYLIVGSAPYVEDWVKEHLQFFLNRQYNVCCINNAWKAVPLGSIEEWHYSNNHSTVGTYIPRPTEIAKIPRFTQHTTRGGARKYYKHFKRGGTMFFNVLYSLLDRHKSKQMRVAVIGCDFIYRKDGDTFYSDREESKAQNDPLLRYSLDELREESEHCYNFYHNSTRDHELVNASPYRS